MIKKLKNRLITITMLLLGIVLIIIFSTLILTSANRMKNESFRNINKDYLIFTGQSKAQTNNSSNNPTAEKRFSRDRSPFKTFLVTLDSNGDIQNVDSFDKQVDLDHLQEAVFIVEKNNETTGTINSLDLRYEVFDGQQKIIGFIDFSFEKTFIQKQIMTYSLVLIISLAVFLAISIFLSNTAIKPIDNAWKKQQQFISDASHELRTPLTVMLANTSILLGGKFIDDNQKKWISNLDIEATHMKTLVNDLLFLARVDSKSNEEIKQMIDLSDTVFQSSLAFEALMFDSGNELEIDIKPNISVYANPNQIKQLVSILLDNAKKYSFENTKITLNLNKDEGKTVLSVHNFGEVIDKNAIPNLFDRFYKNDIARTRNTESSYGLGLAIAKEIANLHNAQIKVNSNKNSGTTFFVYM